MEEEEKKETESKEEPKVEEKVEKPEEKIEEKVEERHNEVKEEKKEEKKEEPKTEPKKHVVVHKSHESKKSITPWVVSTIFLAVIVIGFLVYNFQGGMTGNVISKDVAGQIVLEFANAQADGEIELVGIEEKFGLYEVMVKYQGDDIPLYVTKDGKNLIQGVTPLSVFEEGESESQSTEVPKTDKPVVELFIMTHCPFGTQAEKGIIPTIKALGDAVDAKIRFVHYFMHDPEETETPIQVCIREEQPDKWLSYLGCFLEDGNSSRCLTKTGVDETKIQTCIDNGKAEEYYNADSALSEGYGVRGSPTLVVNGQIVSSGRSSSAYLTAICEAFSTTPDACNTNLSSDNPNPGFGYTVSETAPTDAQC